MSQDDLRAALAALEDEIARGGDDAEHRARLAQLRARIELELAQDEDAARTRELAGSVQEAIRRYEVEHPTLTAVLARILRALEAMGI